MSRLNPVRILQVTAGLSVAGAVVGGVLGAVLVVAFTARGGLHIGDVIGVGAAFGAAMGAVLAPIASWALMRDVPIWRAIAETTVGTVVGAGIGLVFHRIEWLSPPLLGIAGFALAAIRLRLQARRARRVATHP